MQMSPLISLKASEFSANRIAIVTTSRRFNLTKARQLLNYQPLVPQQEAKQRTVQYFSKLRNTQPLHSPGSGSGLITVCMLLLVLLVAFLLVQWTGSK